MDVEIDLQAAYNGSVECPDHDQVALWVSTVLAAHPDETRNELTVRLVDNQESQHLNVTYRGKDKPTNVLSFPFEAPPGIPLPLLGDLVIAADVVAEEAAAQQKPLSHHWAHMIIHGTLHLLGYDHIDPDEAETMESIEIRLLAKLCIPDPYHLE